MHQLVGTIVGAVVLAITYYTVIILAIPVGIAYIRRARWILPWIILCSAVNIPYLDAVRLRVIGYREFMDVWFASWFLTIVVAIILGAVVRLYRDGEPIRIAGDPEGRQTAAR